MNHIKEIGFRKSMMLFFLSILVGIVSLALPARAALIFLDDFEGDGLNAVITNAVRTPTVGAPDSAGWVSPHGAPVVQVVSGPTGKEAFVDMPLGSALDYLGRLGGTYGNSLLFISWDIKIDQINGGWGLFLIHESSRSSAPGQHVSRGQYPVRPLRPHGIDLAAADPQGVLNQLFFQFFKGERPCPYGGFFHFLHIAGP